MSDLLTEFARNTRHKHIYVEGCCKFCQRTTKECKHDELNIKYSTDGGTITQTCTCGWSCTRECLHFRTYYCHYSESDVCKDCNSCID